MTSKDAPWRRPRLILVALGALIVAAALAACGSDDESSGDEGNGDGEIVIGAAVAKTGLLNFTDVPGLAAAEVAVDNINADGGVDGQQLRLISADTKSDRAIAPQVALELIDQGAEVLLVTCDFDYGAPAALAAQEKGVLSMSLCAGEPRFGPEGIGKLAFSAGVATNGEGAAAAQFARDELGAQTAYLLEDPTLVYDQYWVSAFEDSFTELGGEVLGKDTFENSDPSIASQITRIRGLSQEPDVIGMCSYPPGGASAVKQIRAAGIEAPFVSCVAMDGDYWTEAVPNLNDFYTTSYGSVNGDDENEDANQILADVKSAGDAPATSHYLEGYTSVELLAEGIEQAGTTDGEELAAAMEAFDGVEVTLGQITFTEQYHVPQDREVAINEIVDGKSQFRMRLLPEAVPEPRTE
jgi:branched-chain amino acid transport system substrate-binding protein